MQTLKQLTLVVKSHQEETGETIVVGVSIETAVIEVLVILIIAVLIAEAGGTVTTTVRKGTSATKDPHLTNFKDIA